MTIPELLYRLSHIRVTQAYALDRKRMSLK